MSRSLDIAKMLRATEINNVDNNQLIWEADTLDSADIQGIRGVQYYSTLDSLPTSNLIIGTQAFVEDNRRLYISDGNGWYNTQTQSSVDLEYATSAAFYSLSNVNSYFSVGASGHTWAQNGSFFMGNFIWNLNYFFYSYELSTPYDLSTATYVHTTLQQSWVGHGSSFEYSSDGSKFYITRQGIICQIDVPTAYRVGNFDGTSVEATVGTQLGTYTSYPDFFWKSDGTKIYTSDNTAREFHEYGTTTAWDLTYVSGTYASYDFSSDIPSGEVITGMVNKSDLSKFFILTDNRYIYEFEMSTPGDITTTGLKTSMDISGTVNAGSDMTIKHTDNVLYIQGSGGELYTVTF